MLAKHRFMFRIQETGSGDPGRCSRFGSGATREGAGEPIPLRSLQV